MADTKINGRDFTVGEVLATDAVLLQARLMKLIGSSVERLPAIMAGASKTATPEAKEKANAEAVAAFTDIFLKAEPVEMMKLVKDVVELAHVKRDSGSVEKVDMDLDFTNDKGSLYPVVIFVLKDVLGDFFTGLQGAGQLGKLAKV